MYLIFGYKQRGSETIKANNVLHMLTFDKNETLYIAKALDEKGMFNKNVLLSKYKMYAFCYENEVLNKSYFCMYSLLLHFLQFLERRLFIEDA